MMRTNTGPPFEQWKAIAYYDPKGGLKPVIREGDMFREGGTVESFTGFAESNGAVSVLAKARLANGGTRQALLIWKNGYMDGKVLTGVSALDNRVVKSVTTLVPAPGSPASARWIDSEGRLIARLGFGDGGQGGAVFLFFGSTVARE